MKKKEMPSKGGKGRPLRSKNPSKGKSKPKEGRPREEECFILLGDSFYKASTPTEQRSYLQFEQRVRKPTPVQPKYSHHAHPHHSQSFNPEEYLRTLSKEEKRKLLQDLSKEISVEKEEGGEGEEGEEAVGAGREGGLVRLEGKLEVIREELESRWEEQIGSINLQFSSGQISLEDKNEKIGLIEKIRSNKLTMIDYTRLLFQQILTEDGELELHKQQHINHVLSSLQQTDSNEERHQIDEINELSQREQRQEVWRCPDREQEHILPIVNCSLPPLGFNDREQLNLEKEFEEIERAEQKKKEQQQQQVSKESLRLEIRLDEVEFGKDTYDDDQPQKSTVQPPLPAQIIIPAFNPVLPPIQIKEASPEPKKSEQQFLCAEEGERFKIPLLMTRDRLQQLQAEKATKEVQTLNICLKTRQAFQLSELITEGGAAHFTTLIDVNQFIVSFYEFVLKYFLREVIEGMNVPYGKSCSDKLYSLRTEGNVPDHDYNHVLHDEFLIKYHKEVTLSQRKIPDHEKIHNQAVFQAFNFGLNLYRPYYELQGEVYPWSVSQKGLTFYEINEENIEEVFEKSKLKVLQYCATLCGIMPGCEVTTAEARKILSKRNEDTHERVLKTEMNERFMEWGIKVVNFEARSRIQLCDSIFQAEIVRFLRELAAF